MLVSENIKMAGSVRVMSYNIMHKLEGSRLGKFKYCSPAALSYKSRLGRVAEAIKNHSADVVCLQEVDDEGFGTLAYFTSISNFLLSFCCTE